MTKFGSILILFLINTTFSFSQSYSDYFTNQACRLDFHFCGNNSETTVFLDKIKHESFWGGRKSNLSTNFDLGDYRFRVFDSISGNLIYTDGFSSLYNEWQSTLEAKTTNRSFEQSIQFPFPKSTVTIIIEKRTDFDSWFALFSYKLLPTDKLIQQTKPCSAPIKIISKNSSSDKAIDIAIIAEGYTANEKDKFFRDAKTLAESIYSHEPFKTHKNKINIYAIAAKSEDSGISIPQEDEWRNTAIGSHYYTFYEPRYLTSPNVFKIRDYAALVPYDAIYLLANTSNYGGGGIYNFYAMASADCTHYQKEVVVHEFGHSFAGLADEYFREGDDVLDAMYNITIEPWEPNISSLVHFDKKWKNQLPEGTVVPTEITDSSKKYIGIFEGGGYLTKGMYRPHYNCRMRTNEAIEFCSVCKKAIELKIKFLTE